MVKNYMDITNVSMLFLLFFLHYILIILYNIQIFKDRYHGIQRILGIILHAVRIL